MKTGTKVSFKPSLGASAARMFGSYVGECGDLALVATEDSRYVPGVFPVLAVDAERISEVKDGESNAVHAQRVNAEEQAEYEAKAHKAFQAKLASARKPEKKPGSAKTPEQESAPKGAGAAAVAMLLLLLSVFSVQAAETIKLASYSYWSGGSTNAANTLSYLVVPAHPSIANAIPVVMSIDATTDKLAAKVQCYKVTTVAVCAYQTNSTVTLSVVTTNTSPGNISWDSGTVVIRHLLTDQYEKRALTTSIGTTNIVLTAAPLEKVVPGDIIYQVSTTGAPAFTVDTNGVVAATGLSFVRRQGTALVAGQPGMPLLMEIDGTGANATMNNVTARYEAAGPALPRLTP